MKTRKWQKGMSIIHWIRWYMARTATVICGEQDALDKYIRIEAVSFDGGQSWKTDFPLTIPEGLEEGKMLIRVSYRMSAKIPTGKRNWFLTFQRETVSLFSLIGLMKKNRWFLKMIFWIQNSIRNWEKFSTFSVIRTILYPVISSPACFRDGKRTGNWCRGFIKSQKVVTFWNRQTKFHWIPDILQTCLWVDVG